VCPPAVAGGRVAYALATVGAAGAGAAAAGAAGAGLLAALAGLAGLLGWPVPASFINPWAKSHLRSATKIPALMQAATVAPLRYLAKRACAAVPGRLGFLLASSVTVCVGSGVTLA